MDPKKILLGTRTREGYPGRSQVNYVYVETGWESNECHNGGETVVLVKYLWSVQ